MSTFYALNMKATKMALCPLPLSLCGRQHIKKKKVVRQNACQYWDRSPREEGSEERISMGRVLSGKLGNSLLYNLDTRRGGGTDWLQGQGQGKARGEIVGLAAALQAPIYSPQPPSLLLPSPSPPEAAELFSDEGFWFQCHILGANFNDVIMDFFHF